MTVASDRAKYAKQFFIDKGWTPIQADGIVGNLMQESGFRDDVLSGKTFGDSGASGYVGQWNKGRLKNLFNFAGTDNPSFDQQLGFVHHELTAGEEKPAGRKLAKAGDVYSATAAMIGYERPQGYKPDAPERGHGWTNRLKYATQSSQNMLTGPANAALEVASAPPRYRQAVANSLGIEANRNSGNISPRATMLGGMPGSDGIPFPSNQLGVGMESGGPGDNLDTPAWTTKGYAAGAAPIATPAPVTPGGPVNLARPAGPLDAPATENGATNAAQPLQKNVASRVVYKNGQPEFELYDPAAEAQAKIEVVPEETGPDNSAIRGNVGSNTLAGGDESDDDLSQFEGAPTSPGEDDLSQFEEPAVAPGDHHSEMTQRSMDELNAATAEKPLTTAQDSMLGLHNLMHNITLGADTGLIGLASPQAAEDLAAGRERWKAAHPAQALDHAVFGPLGATIAGMGLVGRGLTAAGGEIASAFPGTAGAITQTGRFLSGQLGSWAGSIGDKLARAGNLAGLGAIEGAGQGVAQGALTDQPLSQDALIGGAIGATLGPAGGAIGHVITKDLIADLTVGAKETYEQASKIFTNRAALPQAGRMVAPDSPLGQLHSRVISNEAENKNLRAWTDQAMEFAGSSRKEATLENLEENSRAIGTHFDQIIQAAHVVEDPTLARDLGSIWTDLRQNMHRGAQYSALDREMTRIVGDLASRGGVLSPELYQSITKSTSALGKMIRGNDGDVSQRARDIQEALENWVDRGYAQATANSSTTQGLMNIPGLGQGTPQQLYSAARRRWKLNETMKDSLEASGNSSGVLDPQAFAKASKKRSTSPDPYDPQRVLVKTAMLMPKVTQQGTAIAASSPAQRFISNIINYGTTIGAAASMAGAARWIGASPGSMVAAAGLGAAAASARNAFLKSRLNDPSYLQELLDNPNALARAAGQQSARRNVLTGATIGAGNTIYGR